MIKRCDNHLLAHLYEHMFFIYLDTAFRDRELFPIVDYSIDAYTENGQIVFNVESYHEAVNTKLAISQANTDFLSVPEITEIAITQLESEYTKKLLHNGMKTLEHELERLNQHGWNSDKVYTSETQPLRLGSNIQTYDLEITFRYGNLDVFLKPLYRQVAGLTLNTLISDIADTHGGFVTTEAYSTKSDRSLLGIIRIKDRLPYNDIQKMFVETVDELKSQNGYRRLLDLLQNVSVLENPPSNERTYKDTGVMMDEEKWRQVAKPDSLESVLEALHCDIQIVPNIDQYEES